MQGNLIAYFVDHRGHRLKALLAPPRDSGAGRHRRGGRGPPGSLAPTGGVRFRLCGERRAPGLADGGATSVALLTLTGAGHGRGGSAPGLFSRLGDGDDRVGLLLTLPLEPPARTIVALLCGPVVGIAVHLRGAGPPHALTPPSPRGHRRRVILNIDTAGV